MSKNKNLLDKVCSIIKNKNINVFLEIGSRDGDDSFYVKNKLNLMDENIYIVEPNNISNKNIKNRYPNYTVYEYAITDYDGYCMFNNVTDLNNIGVSSVKNRYDDFYEQKKTELREIRCITGKSLIKKINKKIDYCQIDVEGLTYEVIVGFGDELSNINYILVECEHKKVWEEQKIYEDVKCFLEKTHKMIYSDYEDGNLQSNSLWEKKIYSFFTI